MSQVPGDKGGPDASSGSLDIQKQAESRPDGARHDSLCRHQIGCASWPMSWGCFRCYSVPAKSFSQQLCLQRPRYPQPCFPPFDPLPTWGDTRQWTAERAKATRKQDLSLSPARGTLLGLCIPPPLPSPSSTKSDSQDNAFLRSPVGRLDWQPSAAHNGSYEPYYSVHALISPSP